MGADFIFAVTWLPAGREPDWEAAKQRIATITMAELEEASEEYGYDYPETPPKLEAYRADVANALETVKIGWANDLRSSGIMEHAGYRYLISGGMSWGDDPTELFSAIQLCGGAGVLKAAGFDEVRHGFISDEIVAWLNAANPVTVREIAQACSPLVRAVLHAATEVPA